MYIKHVLRISKTTNNNTTIVYVVFYNYIKIYTCITMKLQTLCLGITENIPKRNTLHLIIMHL